jgi:hypothetical protein
VPCCQAEFVGTAVDGGVGVVGVAMPGSMMLEHGKQGALGDKVAHNACTFALDKGFDGRRRGGAAAMTERSRSPLKGHAWCGVRARAVRQPRRAIAWRCHASRCGELAGRQFFEACFGAKHVLGWLVQPVQMRSSAFAQALYKGKVLMSTFKGVVIFCAVVSFSFTLWVYSVIGNFSRHWLQDIINTLLITGGAVVPTAVLVEWIFRKWRWYLVFVALPVQVGISILIIIVFFLKGRVL